MTLSVRAFIAAVGAIVILRIKLVPDESTLEIVALTSDPLKMTAVAPARLVPVIFAVIVVPRIPVDGTIEETAGTPTGGTRILRTRWLSLSATSNALDVSITIPCGE